jgi:predicted O-methyltransferase YrrM
MRNAGAGIMGAAISAAPLNPVLQRLLETGAIIVDPDTSVSLRHPEFPDALSHIDAESGLLLQRVIREVRPERTLEIGFAYGISTLFICEALASLSNEAKHTVIDPFQKGKWRGLGLRNVADAGFANLLDFREEPSEVALPRLLFEQQRFEFAFIDGLHRFDQVMLEFYYVNRLLRPGGVVVFDDANRRSVNRAIRHALTYPCYQLFAASTAGTRRPTWAGRVRRRLSSVRAAQGVLRRDLLIRDWDLGITGRAVALRKTQEDTRHTYFDAEF